MNFLKTRFYNSIETNNKSGNKQEIMQEQHDQNKKNNRSSISINEVDVIDTNFFRKHDKNNLKKTSLGNVHTLSKNYVSDTIQVTENSNNGSVSIIDSTKYDLLSNVCVCMIDIVGFSTWCSNHLPNVIANTMIIYNDWICNHIEKFPCVKKIELVGDSCMLVSNSTDDVESIEPVNSYLSMIRLCFDLLENINDFKNIFKCSFVGIRIGIHVSDVIGIYLNNPKKYQMFGNDINICSRLESSCIPNTIHVSEKTLMCVQNACKTTCGPCSRSVKGAPIYDKYKGIGYKASYQLFLKKNQILVINTNELFTKAITKLVDFEQFQVPKNKDECMMDCESYKFIGIIINITKERHVWNDIDDVLILLKNQHHFEQCVCLMTNDSMLHDTKKKYEYDFKDIISFESKHFFTTLTSIFDEWIENSKIKGSRGSLDLTIV
jgi:class 3 adenylate cyclase